MSMTARITLVHGWGCDALLWRDVVPLLDGLDVEVADLGFFGRPALPAPCAAPRIAVGHSLGALWWLALTGLPWRALVAINGFARFTAAADFAAGVPPRVLERMRRRFAEAPAAVLAEFHAACGGSPAAMPALPVDTGPLAAGLGLLAASDGRAVLGERSGDVWALATRDDAIVPPAMSSAAFAALPAGRLHWLDAGGHLLPRSQPQACAALIRAAAGA